MASTLTALALQIGLVVTALTLTALGLTGLLGFWSP